MKIAFIGIGNVGLALAHNLQLQGHTIVIGHDDLSSESVLKALEHNRNFTAKPLQLAVDSSDVVFLATPFQANEAILRQLKFKNQILVDCTNPVGAGISHGLESSTSGSEKIQEWAKEARVVKAFTIYGFENFQNSSFPEYNVKPAMLIAGNDIVAKETVALLCDNLGFEAIDTGGLDQALHLEHMTLLWVKMVRRDHHHPHFVWGYLERK